MGLAVFDERAPFSHDTGQGSGIGTTAFSAVGSRSYTVRLDAWVVGLDAAADHLVEVVFNSTILCVLPILAGAGQGTVDPFDVMAYLLANASIDHITLDPGDSLNVRLKVALSSGESIYSVTMGGYLAGPSIN